ncbi:universal stress protein [Aquabacterium sp.]|jgi:nucleotide-binding universal stress UspA family protein|uniref:universal stress protein n=1 Tax=Aquabacterium sp. TaxID=1872578 RepID=UPI004037F364
MQNKVIACVDTRSQLMSLCDGAAWAAQKLSAPLILLQVLERHPETAQHLDVTGQIGLGAQESVLQELAQLDHRRSVLAQEQGRQILDGMRVRALAAGVVEVECLQRHGELAETVSELDVSGRMLVMGRQEHRLLAGRALDHHIERVLRSTHKPVLVMTGPEFEVPTSFVLAYDGSDTAARLLGHVASNPLLQGMRCHLVHADARSAANEAGLSRAGERLRQAGFEFTVTLEEGDVSAVISRTVARQGAGLLVMSANGHSRLRQLVLGSTTSLLLRGSVVPVLVAT